MRFAITTLAFLTPLLAQESSWLTNFEEAKATAKKEKKVILADFTGSDWCGWCIKLKEEVFSKPEFTAWAKDKVVLLELDFPKKTKLAPELEKQNQELKKKFSIQGYPTVLVLDAEGNKLGELGYQPGGPEAWTKKADEVIANAAAADVWMTDYEAALAKAKKEKKFVLADFTGSDWCGWCIKLKEEVFSKPEFAEWAKENVVLLEVDFPRTKKQSDDLKKQNQDLAKEFGIQGYPTIVFLDAKGKKVGEMGYEKGGPDAWLPLADKQLGIKSKKKKK